MAVGPNQQRPNRKAAGTGAHEPDSTSERGNYDDSPIFGGPLPRGTGAPGSGGGAGGGTGAPTDTTEAGQLTDGLTGITDADITETGAPGSRGADSGFGGGGDAIFFTLPGSEQSGTYTGETVNEAIGGPADSTQANVDGYASGGPQLPGIKGNEPEAGEGRYQPGRGNVMRGGRSERP